MDVMENKEVITELIKALAKYAEVNGWSDRDFLSDLEYLGISMEDLYKCLGKEYVNSYLG